jgi:hypothetical protein
MWFVVTSGPAVREYVDQREGAGETLKHVLFLMRRRRPNIRILDEDGRQLKVNDLRRLEAQESQTKGNRAKR